MPRIVLVCLIFFSSTLTLLAATGQTVEVTCPVCATTLKGTIVLSADTAAGVDRDLMEWSVEGSALFLRPVTCPTCTFSASRVAGFRESVSAAVQEHLSRRKLPEHQPIEPNSRERQRYGQGLESPQTVPVWIRLSLVAEQKTWDRAPALTRASAWQEVAWAIRLEQNPFGPLLDEVPDSAFDRLFARLQSPESNQAVEEVKLGRDLLAEFTEQNQTKARESLILAGFMLRRHGEFKELEQHLTEIEAELGVAFRVKLEESIANERVFLKRCLEVLEAEVVPTTSSAVEVYLAGELFRRIGFATRAQERYQQALGMEGLPDRLRPWVLEQLALVEESPEKE